MFDVIFLLIGVGIIIFFIFFPLVMLPLVIDQKVFPDFNFSLIVVLSLLWFTLLFQLIKRADENDNLRFANYFHLILLVACYLYFLAIKNKRDATEILAGKAKYAVKFEFQGKAIQTDSDFVFIGKTSDYLFFRSLKENKNAVYNTSEIKKMELIRLKK